MTKFIQSFKMAIKSILGNKFRSALTMLGIVIGVASVIILTGIGAGSSQQMTEELESMGTNLITVSINRRASSRSVKIDDIKEFQEKNSQLVSAVSPTISGNATLKYGTTNFTTSLEGVDSSYEDITKVKLTSGRFIGENDVENRSNVVVVGTYIQQEAFGGENPVGQEIKLNGKLFKIIGVYEEASDSTEKSEDNKITMPYTTAMRFVKNTNITTFYVSAASEDVNGMAVAALKSFMTRKLGSDEGFTVMSMKEILDTMNQMMSIMTNMLAGIAAISLLVGGIGIMNIMTVSVSERTREIGIRKAIGARTTDILLQFLIESVILSCMGGVIGILFGIGAGMGVGALLGIQFAAETGMMTMSFLFALFVGVFFGLSPAKKAAKLNPIEALRSE
jgi:putative ABC transport system permease protein